MAVLSLQAFQYLLHYKFSIPKFLPAPISPMSARSLQKKIIKVLEFTLTNCIFCFNKKFYKLLQGAAMCSPVFPVNVNIYIVMIAMPYMMTNILTMFLYIHLLILLLNVSL